MVAVRLWNNDRFPPFRTARLWWVRGCDSSLYILLSWHSLCYIGLFCLKSVWYSYWITTVVFFFILFSFSFYSFFYTWFFLFFISFCLYFLLLDRSIFNSFNFNLFSFFYELGVAIKLTGNTCKFNEEILPNVVSFYQDENRSASGELAAWQRMCSPWIVLIR